MSNAEDVVLENEGNVIRLAGLYTDQRGAHTYWMKMVSEGKTIETNEDGLVNLIHYEDAARLVLASLDSGKIFYLDACLFKLYIPLNVNCRSKQDGFYWC